MKRATIVIMLALLVLAGAVAFADVSATERAQIKKVAQKHAGMRIDFMTVDTARDWAFVDVAQKGAGGSWETSISLLMRKKNGVWTFLAKGDVHSDEWKKYTKQMPPDVQKAQQKWDAGHY